MFKAKKNQQSALFASGDFHVLFFGILSHLFSDTEARDAKTVRSPERDKGHAR